MRAVQFTKLALSAAVAGLFVVACGGGGGGGGSTTSSATLSGTVAGGAAVIGTVLITDSLGATKGATIEANGRYTVDVSGMTGPFVIKAAGTVGNTSVTYYSAATQADVGGTVNVTPFTNMIVANIAAQMAENYFSGGGTVGGLALTPAKLLAAETALQAKLQPVLTALGVSDSIDLLRSSFSADHSGLDAVMDMVKVEADTSTNVITLKNAITNVVIASDNATQSTDDATAVDNTKIAEITPTAVTDLQAIVTQLNAFASLFASGLPSQSTIENHAAFDATGFMMGGKSLAQFATELSTSQQTIGLKFSNVAIQLDATGTNGVLTAIITSNTATFKEKIALKMAKIGGVWKIQGDGRKAEMKANAQAEYSQWEAYNSSGVLQTTGSSKVTGVWLNIDPQAWNASNPGAGTKATQALVTGPGLPAGGVTFSQDTQNTWFKVDPPNTHPQYIQNLIPECGSNVYGTTWSTTAQCVNVAQALDGSEYTVVLKNAAGTSLNGSGDKLVLAKKPFTQLSLTNDMFPSLTSILVDGAPLTLSTVLANKNVALTWTVPTDKTTEGAVVWANVANGDSYLRVEKDLLPTATSVVIGLGTPLTTGTVTRAGAWVSVKDTYGRTFALSKSAFVQ